MKILVTGAKGQVGSELRELGAGREETFFFTDREELDITDREAVFAFVKENDIDAIINCAAYTAVDRAETEPGAAEAVNHHAVAHLAEAAKEYECRLIHISTDYVYDGRNHLPYIEEDPTDPQGVYGKTKLAGEEAMKAIDPSKSIIIRTSWVYSSYGSNFVKTMLRLGKERNKLGVIFDQVGTPTYARDLAETILQILPRLQNEHTECYHYSDEGVCSWYDFAKEIMRMAKLGCRINPIESKEYPTPAKRPHYSVLNKAKIKKEFGVEIPYWKDSLDACLQKLGERR